MKKVIIVGVLFALCVLTQPITVMAHDRQCPEPIEVTYEEAQELMRIAWCEAGNQGIDGQRMIMCVVLNRVNNPDFPDNIHDVIHQPYQFATAGMSKAQITPDTHMALAELEMGNLTPEIIAFENCKSNSLEEYFTPVFTLKDHTFYVVQQ